MESAYHIMIDDLDDQGCKKVYKIVTKYSEKHTLTNLAFVVFLEKYQPKHFILPIPVPETDIFAYPKVVYGPLDRLWARQCLRTLVKKIHKALSELHGKGFAHADIRLLNICFNCDYEAVLIDLDRCVSRNMYSTLAMSFEGNSCMYSKPDEISARHFKGEHLD